MTPDYDLLFLGALLFSAGLSIVIIKRNMIFVLMGIELLLNSSVLNLVAFNRIHNDVPDGQIFGLFVIVIAVCEAAVGLAIVIQVYRYYQSSVPDQINELKE
ncbi:NADH-quinone oxidoreductase subunit NuoK [Chryseolinea sp. T2]|uniref:NADH-quinone oxidoreductase subunit NuoK n=1 Tax=Chryseolinea sp. T2 TaxID=3129255 RepID=UPI0030789A9F